MTKEPNALTTSLSDSVKAFASAFSAAQDHYLTAARLYADAVIAHGPASREAFSAAHPNVSQSTWRRLESVGAGVLDARLLTAGSVGASSLRRLPIHLQQEALNGGVTVLVSGGDTLVVAVDALTPDQTRQVFANDHVRTPSAQRAWIESRKMPDIPALDGPAATVKAGKVVVNRPCTLTRLDLARLLAEMG